MKPINGLPAFLPAALATLTLACAATKAPPERPSAPAQPPPASSRVESSSPEQAAVDRALATSSPPAAAVVLGLDGQMRLLAVGRHAGADPISLRARPGSTMKPLTAWVAAERGAYHAGDTVTCHQHYPTFESFSCFTEHGTLDLPTALAVSCNIYFAELGARLGLGPLTEGLRDFGLDRPTGLVAGEATGFIGDPTWARTRPNARTERWELFVAAGHGPFEVTLLELAAAYAKLAVQLQQPSPRVSEAIRSEIETGLRRVVDDPEGTGRRAAVAGLEIAGKTGSAESSPFSAGPSDAPDNGWFVGYTPVKAPRRLVAVVVLGAGGGRDTAAPLAGKIFEALRDGLGPVPNEPSKRSL